MNGVCKFCGCTELNGCVVDNQVCHWVNADQNICSACEGMVEGESLNRPNQYTMVLTKEGFIERLIYQGHVYIKRYQKDTTGYHGLDKGWEFDDLPDEIIEALETRDPLEIMSCINDV